MAINFPHNPNVNDVHTESSLGKSWKWDGTTWKIYTTTTSGIGLGDLSVSQQSVGTAALTYNNTSGVFTYTPPDLSAGSSRYTLPTASATVLGGIKVGSNLTIDANGVLAGVSSYTLPTASTTVLGGVKIDGTTITISNGVISGAPSVPTTITVADESGDTSCYPLFVTDSTGNLAPKTGTNFAFNSSSGQIEAGSFKKTGGSSSEFLKADGSIDSNTYLTSSDGNTTYSQSSVASAANVNLRLTGSDSTNDDILVTAGSNITFSSVTASGFTINSTGGGGSGNQGNDSVAVGSICIWSGTVANIPTGWALCDGQNNTVDLRDKFIIGAKQDDGGVAKTGITGSLTQTGGSKDAIVVEHNHAAGSLGTSTTGDHTHTGTFTGSASTSSNGDHNHNDPTWNGQSGNYEVPHNPPSNETNNHVHSGGGGYDYGNQSAPTTTDGSHAHDFSVATSGTTSSNGDHSHSVTGATANDGGSGTNANLPPYYALCYIQKTTAGGASFSLSVSTGAASGGGSLSYNNTTGVFSFAPAEQTTITGNADNRIITGSGTAGTLNGESNATYDGSKLNIDSTDGSGQSITSSGIIKAGTHLEAAGRLSVNENIQSNGFTYTQSTNSLVVDGSVSDGAGNVRELVNNAKTAAYTLTANDVGELINTDSNVTIPSGIFSAGQAITIYNNSGSNITLSRSGVTMYTAGTSTNTDKTLAEKGICTVVCVSSNTFVASGAGMS